MAFKNTSPDFGPLFEKDISNNINTYRSAIIISFIEICIAERSYSIISMEMYWSECWIRVELIGDHADSV